MRCSEGEGSNAPHAPRPAGGWRGKCGKFSRSQATPGKGLNAPGKLADGDRVQISELVPALPRLVHQRAGDQLQPRSAGARLMSRIIQAPYLHTPARPSGCLSGSIKVEH